MCAAGVEPPRLATGQLSVHPDWEVVKGQQRPGGYRATAGLTARLDAPARAGQVASAAVAADGEAARVHGLALAGGYQAQAARAAASPSVEVGEAEVPARVAVTWALLDAPQPGVVERS